MSKILESISIPVIVGIILFLCLIVLFVWRRKVRKKEKKVNEVTTNKLREVALEDTLKNKNKKTIQKEIKRSEPYEVDYGNGNVIIKQKIQSDTETVVFLKVIEHSELSSREYMQVLSENIYFGRHFHKNQFVINDDAIAEKQCKLWYDKESKSIKVKNLVQKNKVIIRRNKENISLATNSMKLLFGDELIFEKMTYDLYFYDVNGKKQYKK
jgi:hypothetical protein